MPGFVHAPLLWGLGLVGLPLLIHLINLLRHRKVNWAAIEFLLESQRKNQNWVRLRQFLLLLCRVLAIAAAVLMFARPLLKEDWLRFLAGGRTHQIILLDDSYSMGDRYGEVSAFDRAKEGLARLGQTLSQAGSPQAVTLLRFSQVGGAGKQGAPDLIKSRVGPGFGDELAARLQKMQPSETAAGPLAACQAVKQLVDDSRADACVIHILSDFRIKDWERAEDLQAALSALTASGAKLRMVPCVEAPHANLGIEGLRLLPGTHVSGVPVNFELTVRNHSSTPQANVTVSITEDGVARQSVLVESIPPGEAVTNQFALTFSTPGEHALVARLPADCLDVDNQRYAVVPVAERVQTLILADDVESADVRAITTALNPGGNAVTGIAPRVETPSFLREGSLADFSTVYALDCARWDESALQRLETFVRQGGGLALFMGPQVDVSHYNARLYQNGAGLLPAPLRGPMELLVNRLERTPDIQFEAHPIFQAFTGRDSSLLSNVYVETYCALDREWRVENASGVRILAKLRNGAPLALEKQLDQGKVVLFLTTAGGAWNNWSRVDPSFVVTVLEMQSYLTGGRRNLADHLVGTPWSWEVPASEYQRDVTIKSQSTTGSDAELITLQADAQSYRFQYGTTDRSGILEAILTRLAGSQVTKELAVNVNAAEGAMSLQDSAGLAQVLGTLKFDWVPTEQLGQGKQASAGIDLTTSLFILLLALLVAEQLLAYAASYHVSGESFAAGQRGSGAFARSLPRRGEAA